MKSFIRYTKLYRYYAGWLIIFNNSISRKLFHQF